jgi:hypothetical protein
MDNVLALKLHVRGGPRNTTTHELPHVIRDEELVLFWAAT